MGFGSNFGVPNVDVKLNLMGAGKIDWPAPGGGPGTNIPDDEDRDARLEVVLLSPPTDRSCCF